MSSGNRFVPLSHREVLDAAIFSLNTVGLAAATTRFGPPPHFTMHLSLGDSPLGPTGRAVSAGKSIPYFDVVDPLIQWQSSASIDLR